VRQLPVPVIEQQLDAQQRGPVSPTDRSRESVVYDIGQQTLQHAKDDPRIALMYLASQMEWYVRKLAYIHVRGLYANQPPTNLVGWIEDLDGSGKILPPRVRDALKYFSDIRNRIVHHHDATPDEIIRAIDSGLTILKALEGIPREINIVYHPGVDIYADK